MDFEPFSLPRPGRLLVYIFGEGIGYPLAYDILKASLFLSK